MESDKPCVITLDAYSLISNGRKITVQKGEKFLELSRPNNRWVEVSKVSDSTRFFLPSAIIALDSQTDMEKLSSEQFATDSSSNLPEMDNSAVSDHSNSPSSRRPIVVIRRKPKNDIEVNKPAANLREITPVEEAASRDSVQSLSESPSQSIKNNVRSSTMPASISIELATQTATTKPYRTRWKRMIEDGREVYLDQETNKTWISATDEYGNPYYYEADSRQSVWNLEAMHDCEDLTDTLPDASGDAVPTGSTDSLNSVATSDAVSLYTKPIQMNPSSSADSPEMDGRFELKRIAKEHISGPQENKLTHFERRGFVNRAKLMIRGKPVTQKWCQSLLILSGPWLMFYKDAKSATPKSSQPQGKPDCKIHIQLLTVTEPDPSVTTKRCTLQLEDLDPNAGKSVFLVEFPEKVFSSWKAALQYAKEILHNEERLTPKLAQSTLKNLRPTSTKLDNNLLSKFRDFFHSRPTPDALRARGILKNEPVFASTLIQICENEQSEVPRFVVCAIRAIEARGINQLGIYRVSSSAADVQKLRCCVNQYNYSLNSDKWNFTTLTGALKLFFRELKEPLVTFDLTEQISELLTKKIDPSMKVSSMHALLSSMPACHFTTAKVLFHHLYRVTQCSDQNQMDSHNLAIVFGPSLIRTDTMADSLGMLASVQAPFVDFCLKYVVDLFGPVSPPPVVS